MQSTIRAAAIVQLAQHFGIPRELVDRMDALARGSPDKVANFIDMQIRSTKERLLQQKLTELRNAILSLNKDQQFDGDMGTMLANFERIVGRPFFKPAWLSSELNKIETEGSNS